jgi:hypothetical protein
MVRGVVPLLALFATLGMWSTLGVRLASAQQDVAAEEEEPPPVPEGAVVVIVETARRAIGPAAIRAALEERLEGAVVRGLSDREGPTRAWVGVAVHRDGSADVRVVSSNGNDSTAHIESGGELSPAMAIAHRIGELLGAAAADPPIGSVARHGLIPWEDEGLRAYPAESPFHRIDGESLLPWPQRGEERSGRPARGAERAAGLSAPPPGRSAQNR